ncbi:protein MAIN-LIKE 1-like [Vicia villosa]|uniref:protein MAIN-LIKE 1-like n=1 Tax=Vicia villosa TaxID=3911 RepID=UPI00273C620B|nr:protein MAIN-LIKE 1-like [Vicia villosa]
MAFAERWHPETSSFHLPHGEITITLDDVACLLHIPIKGTFLGHDRLTKKEAREALIVELGAGPEDALEEVERTRSVYASSSYTYVVYMRYLSDITHFHEYNWGAATLANNYYRFGEGCWILQHFPMIIGWGEVPGYTKAMPCARVYILFSGNQVSDPYKHSFDCMAAEDIRYNRYATHRETVAWDDVALYSGWLAASSTIDVCYLPERVMR